MYLRYAGQSKDTNFVPSFHVVPYALLVGP
jgi:hypothetical protein